MSNDKRNIAGLIDHTALHQDVDRACIERLCAEALEYGFHRVFVPPSRVDLALSLVESGGVGVGSVAGFPFGYELAQTKVAEATEVIKAGALDVDMVANIGLIKDGRWTDVVTEIAAVCAGARLAGGRNDVTIKVIIETCLLTEAEKVRAAKAVKEAGADYVKTSTGLAGGGATVEDVVLLRKAVGPNFGVKASGGIRTAAQLRSMVEAGADRIGTSASVAIMET